MRVLLHPQVLVLDLCRHKVAGLVVLAVTAFIGKTGALGKHTTAILFDLLGTLSLVIDFNMAAGRLQILVRIGH